LRLTWRRNFSREKNQHKIEIEYTADLGPKKYEIGEGRPTALYRGGDDLVTSPSYLLVVCKSASLTSAKAM